MAQIQQNIKKRRNLEQVLYTVRPKQARIIIPGALFVLILLAVFYYLFQLVFDLLKLAPQASVNMLLIAVLIALFLAQLLLSIFNAKKTSYNFFSTGVSKIGPRQWQLSFYEVTNAELKRGFFDRIFKTGTIKLGHFELKGMENYEQLYSYTQNLILRAKSAYQ